MRICLSIIALAAGMLAFVPTSASADIGPCNTCEDSPSPIVVVDQTQAPAGYPIQILMVNSTAGF
jgi:hypothetical protein